MAILNYGNQFKYSGKGYIDSKMVPVESVDALESNVSVLSANYMPGMKVMVLNDEPFGPCEYYLNDSYEWKRVLDLDKITLSLDRGDFEVGDDRDEIYLQLNYNGEVLGTPIDLSVLLEDVEARIEALENKENPEIPSVEDTNTFVENATLVTEKEGENGIFIKFDYNDGKSFYCDVTSLEPKTYANGMGILIGEDNVISIDETWFNDWFEGKVVELNDRLAAVEGEMSEVKENVRSLSDLISTISGRVDTQDGEISNVKNGLASALEQIAENKVSIEDTKALAEGNAAEISTLAEKLAKIRGVEYVKAGENVTVETDEDGNVIVSAVIPEISVDLSSIEGRLDNVEGAVAQHTSEIASLQDAVKNLTPDGEGVSGDNVTIKTNENGSLSVMISAQENNAVVKNNDGIFVQGIEIFMEDDEINADEE